MIVFLFAASIHVRPVHAEMPVEAEGVATIGSDIHGARELAILRAEGHALEALGVGIKSETIAARASFWMIIP